MGHTPIHTHVPMSAQADTDIAQVGIEPMTL